MNRVPRACLLILVLIVLLPITAMAEGEETGGPEGLPWWAWSLILLVFSFFLGIVAVIGGVGGGVLFVPIVSLLFPFHLDYVRGAGLMVALTGALSAAPHLLRSQLASLKMALPFALLGSVGSIFGAFAGLALPTNVVKILLGAAIMAIVILMAVTRKSEYPTVAKADVLSQALKISGIYHEPSSDTTVEWKIHRSAAGLAVFVGIGFLAGLFGIGAGWANVPALNLLLGAPLKIAVATSGLIVSINNTAAAWVYINKGALLPIIAVPSVAGMMVGTRLGARILTRVKPSFIKWIVVGLLVVPGIRTFLEGLGVWS